MVKRFLVVLMALVISMCLVCSNVIVSATGPNVVDPELTESGGGLSGETDPTVDDPILTPDPETTPETTPEPTPTPDDEEEEEEEVEEDEEEEEEDEEEDDEEDEEEESTEESTEADGSFIVFLVMDNEDGTQTWEMTEAGIVPMPREPEKIGYLFDGWYSDKDFKNPWNFATDIATEEMTIYAKWIRDPNAILYDIEIVQTAGGNLSVNTNQATPGEWVIVTVSPDEGMRLKNGGLTVNGEAVDVLSFRMPSGNVLITATFEEIPEAVVEEEGSNAVIIIIAGSIIAVLLVIAIIMLKRRNAIIVPEFDESGAVIIDDDEEVWIDESIVVESGFREGRKMSEINPPNIEDD